MNCRAGNFLPRRLPRVLVRAASVLLLMLTGAAFGESVESKASRIRVPLLELREATIEESLRVLVAKSREFDPSREGVNFVWGAPLPAETRVNLRLVNVPLREAARYVARLTGVRLTADRHALVFAPDDGGGARPAFRVSPAAEKAATFVLPRVEFRDATLPATLDYLVNRSRALDPEKLGINVVLDVPPEQRETRITLSLRDAPLREALRYAAQLANLIVVEEPYALVVTTPKLRQHEPAPKAKTVVEAPRLKPLKGLTGTLAEPAEPASTGKYESRTTSGAIQPEKSGYVPRRSMGGWPVALDPRNKLGVNCPHCARAAARGLSQCPPGTCGCKTCCCVTW